MTAGGEGSPVPPGRRRARRERLRLALLGGVLAPLGMALAGMGLAWALRGENLVAAAVSGSPAAHPPGAPAWAGRVLPGPGAGVPGIVAWGLAASAASLGVSLALAAVWPRFAEALERAGVQSADRVLRLAGWPVLVLVVACGAVGEEMLFRGGVQPTLGVWPTALLFGLAHGGWDLPGMWSYVIAAGLAGVAFGYAYAWTGVLWVPVVAHVAHNLAVVAYVACRQRRSRPPAAGPPEAPGEGVPLPDGWPGAGADRYGEGRRAADR